jgi:hypothetical protein
MRVVTLAAFMNDDEHPARQGTNLDMTTADGCCACLAIMVLVGMPLFMLKEWLMGHVTASPALPLCLLLIVGTGFWAGGRRR